MDRYEKVPNSLLMHNYSIPRKPVPEVAYYAAPTNEEDTVCKRAASNCNSTDPHQSTKSLSVSKTWWLEILAALATTSALVAIIVSLLLVDGKPLPKTPYNISVNTLIAILATTLKVTAAFVLAQGLGQSKWSWYQTKANPLLDFQIYDNASRGPWGALQFLWHLRCRPVIASLGAMATISVLFVDPLSQQLIRLYDCSEVVHDKVAQIPRTRYYDTIGGHITAGQNGVDPGFMGSLATGQFSHTPPQVPITCETGNCTFTEPYNSVGYCSSCWDVSEQIVFRNFSHTGRKFNVTIQLGNIGYRTGISFLAGDSQFQGERFSMNGNTNNEIDMVWFDGLGPRLFDDYNEAKPADNTPRGHAYRCALEPCIHEFRAEIKKGRLIEDTTARVNVTFGRWTGHATAVVDTKCLDQNAIDDLKDLGYQISGGTRWVPYNVTVYPFLLESDPNRYVTARSFNVPQIAAGVEKGFYVGNSSNWTLSESGLRIAPSKCIYQSRILVASSMSSLWFKNYFVGNVTDTFYNSDVFGDIVPRYTYTTGKNHSIPGQGLDAISSMMQNITDSMTTYMRWHGNQNMSEAVVGEVHRYAICIAVRWGYITYSGAIVLAVLVFLPAMIINTLAAGRQSMENPTSPSLSPQNDFKSSALATLFHGLELQKVRQNGDLGSRNSVRELEMYAKTRQVRLMMTKQGWKLVDVSSRY